MSKRDKEELGRGGSLIVTTQKGEKGPKPLAGTDLHKVIGKLGSFGEVRVVYTPAYVVRNTLDDLEKYNQDGKAHNFCYVFGDNDADFQNAKIVDKEDKKEKKIPKPRAFKETRYGHGGQAAAFVGRDHKRINKVAAGVVTVSKLGAGSIAENAKKIFNHGKRNQRTRDEALEKSFNESLDNLYKRAIKGDILIVPVTLDRSDPSKIHTINIGTGIAADKISKESVEQMQEALQIVLSDIENGRISPDQRTKRPKIEITEISLMEQINKQLENKKIPVVTWALKKVAGRMSIGEISGPKELVYSSVDMSQIPERGAKKKGADISPGSKKLAQKEKQAKKAVGTMPKGERQAAHDMAAAMREAQVQSKSGGKITPKKRGKKQDNGIV